MSLQVDKSRKIPGTTVFDGRESRKGYRINRFAMSFTRPENREAFKADEEAYMARYGLSDKERQFLRDRNLAGLIEECGERSDPAMDDQRRRYYRLSGLGQRALQMEAGRLERQVSLARSKRVLGIPLEVAYGKD